MKQYMLCALAAAVIANTAAPMQYVYADDTFESGDKIVGDVEIGDFDLPEEPEVSVEPAPDVTVDEGEDETIPITPEEPEITVDVDIDVIKPEEEPVISIEEEGTKPTPEEEETVIVYEPESSEKEDDTFESSDKVVGDVEIGDFDLPEATPSEPEVTPGEVSTPSNPEETVSTPSTATPSEPERSSSGHSGGGGGGSSYHKEETPSENPVSEPVVTPEIDTVTPTPVSKEESYELPPTGDNSIAFAGINGIAGIGLALLSLFKRKRKIT